MNRNDIIAQRTPFDCMFCCLCMANGLTYETGLELTPPGLIKLIKEGPGWNFADTMDALVISSTKWNYRFGLLTPSKPAILSVPSRTSRQSINLHAIYYENGLVFDPTPNRVMAYSISEALRNLHGVWQREEPNAPEQTRQADAGVSPAH